MGREVSQPVPGEQVAADSLVERRRSRFARGPKLASVGELSEVIYKSHSQLSTELVNHPKQDAAVVCPQIINPLWVCGPSHGVVGLLQGIFCKVQVTCPRSGKALDPRIIPDGQQLLKMIRPSDGNRGTGQVSHPQSSIGLTIRVIKTLLFSTQLQ